MVICETSETDNSTHPRLNIYSEPVRWSYDSTMIRPASRRTVLAGANIFWIPCLLNFLFTYRVLEKPLFQIVMLYVSSF